MRENESSAPAANGPLRVEVWADVVCPFCWIGKRHLEAAIDRLGLSEDVEVVPRAFELDPNAASASEPLMEHLAQKFGGPDAAARMVSHVRQMGEAAGLPFDFESAVAANTFDAHRVIALAREQGVGHAVSERLYRAHFTEGADLGDAGTLRRLAVDAGLDADAVAEVLASDRFADVVRADEAAAHQLQVRGVPFTVVGRRVAVSGAQPVDAFVRALEQARSPAVQE